MLCVFARNLEKQNRLVQIILFGSYARGDNRTNSDIDILIIKKDLKNEREITNILYKAFFEKKDNSFR
ncbi:MAG: nucleotidyltransferase domain-containing protein [Planctomycetaceae bacterium]|nr:nucleotidyltransferase domain-containing protein [Planctomycetaceae bacterium]